MRLKRAKNVENEPPLFRHEERAWNENSMMNPQVVPDESLFSNSFPPGKIRNMDS